MVEMTLIDAIVLCVFAAIGVFGFGFLFGYKLPKIIDYYYKKKRGNKYGRL